MIVPLVRAYNVDGRADSKKKGLSAKRYALVWYHRRRSTVRRRSALGLRRTPQATPARSPARPHRLLFRVGLVLKDTASWVASVMYYLLRD